MAGVEPIPWFVEPVRAALAATPSTVMPRDGSRPSAVLLMLYDHAGEPGLVFTKRSELVRHHKGEISFPGGGMEPGDASLEQTAVRETVEELGVDPSDITIIGDMAEMLTYVTGFLVKPYVAHVPAREAYAHSEAEIAEVLRVPLRTLVDVGREAEWEARGYRFTTNVFEVGPNVIWGATGKIVRDFLDVVAPALDLPWPRAAAEPG